MNVMFDLVNIYYIPQFQPIIAQLLDRGHDVCLVCDRRNFDVAYDSVIKGFGWKSIWVENDQKAAQLYKEKSPDWIIFGNTFKYLDQLSPKTKTAQLGHGIGPKPSYYHKSSTPMTVRFIEGVKRLEKIKELYPNDEFVQVGFSKLDPIFNASEQGLNLDSLGLNKERQTILYAPTFNPSSLECFPDDWPLDFSKFNILIKPHSFTYTIDKYSGQRSKLKKWAEYENVHVADPNELSLVPYLSSADILISEASSTLFEFVALDKPVVVCDFYKLKWSYRGIFRYRFKKRFGTDNVLYRDIGPHVKSYKALKSEVHNQLAHPGQYQKQRKQYTLDHVGPTDGLASSRIVEYLEAHN